MRCTGGRGGRNHERTYSINPNVCHGQACIRGTRIPVHQIVGMLANGDSFEDLLDAFSTIQREDVLACLEYAARLAERADVFGYMRGSVTGCGDIISPVDVEWEADA